MCKIYLPEYSVNMYTLAIIPERPCLYKSVVFEDSDVVYVDKPALPIIKDGCEDAWSTYEGRRHCVVNRTRYKYKVMIPIDPDKNIFMFPTHSALHPENCWFNPHGILHTFDGERPGTSIVMLKNSIKIVVPVSKTVMDAQRLKALECIALIKEDSRLDTCVTPRLNSNVFRFDIG